MSDSLLDESLRSSAAELAGTEKVLPPLPVGKTVDGLPGDFPTYPSLGDGVLLLIPTKNAFKIELLTRVVGKLMEPRRVVVQMVSADSEVNEQPYNGAGLRGAQNRIKNALKWLDGAGSAMREEHKIGTVLVAAIENYIELEPPGEAPAADFGVVVLYNAANGKWALRFSAGVTAPAAYVAKARSLGFSDEAKLCGNVTMGKVLAANAPDVPDDNWHLVVAGVSRYDLLTTAAEAL